MPERVTFGPVELWHGDAREIVPRLAPADLLVTDPPYRLTSGGNTPGGMSGGWLDGYDNKGQVVPCEITWAEIMALGHAALKPDADAYVMSNDRNLWEAMAAATGAGFRFHRLLVWDKITATANRWYMPNCEFALYLWKGRARRIRDAGSKALMRFPQRDVTDHPTEKPVPLLRYWLENSSDPGDLVLDPFAGSGATLSAAAQAGRRAIGIELHRPHFEAACARLEADLARLAEPDLLTPRTPPAAAPALFPSAQEESAT